jgi:Caspase domain
MFSSRIGFLSLFAFEIPLLKRMSQRYVDSLFLPYLLTLICSCFLIAVSATYVVLIVPHINAFRIVTATSVFLVVFLFMFHLERLFVALSAFPLENSIDKINQWFPDKTQKFFIGIFSIIFAIPFLMLINVKVIDSNVRRLAEEKSHIYEASELQNSMNRQSELLKQKILLQEKLSRAQLVGGINLPNNSSTILNKENTNSSTSVKENTHRKALVIGVEHYPRPIPPTDYSISDVRLVSKELKRMGFDVTMSEDETAAQIRLKILSYVKSLESGVDYSVVYYAGHGFQIKDQNYITAIDLKYSGKNTEDSQKETEESSISIKHLLKDVAFKKPLLNMIILDSCRSFFGQKLKGLAPFEINDLANDYIIFSATEPDRVSRADDTLKHGIFTYALTKYLALPESIFSIMPKVTAQVKALSTKARDSNPYCLNNLNTNDKDAYNEICSIQHPEYKTNTANPDYQLLALGYPKAQDNQKDKKKVKFFNSKDLANTPNNSINNEILDSNVPEDNIQNQICSQFKTSNLQEPQLRYLNCLRAEIRMLDNQLKEEDQLQKFGLGIKKDWYINTLLSSGMLDERIHNMFFATNYIQNSGASQLSFVKRYLPLLTVILNLTLFCLIAALIYSGVWLRYSSGAIEARREYEKLRYLQSREAIVDLHRQTTARVDTLMSKFKAFSSDSLPKFKIWDDLADFYREEKPATVNPSKRIINSREVYDRFISELTPKI